MLEQVKEFQNGMSNGEVLSGRPGIVVLSPSLQVLHMNRQAQILIRDVVPTALEVKQLNDRTHVLPPVFINLAGEILRVLRSRHERSEKGLLEIRHAANWSDRPVFVRGVGVPNGHGVEHARIVLFLTETSTDPLESHQSLGNEH
jgi:hypothetical protein